MTKAESQGAPVKENNSITVMLTINKMIIGGAEQ
jgi:hypothetical protein